MQEQTHDYNQTRSFNLGIAQELSVEAALVYDELSFWSTKSSDGWIYKTYEQMKERLPFSEYQLRTAYKKLEEAGYIETTVKKNYGTPKLHFRILKNFKVDTQKISVSKETKKIKVSNITATTNSNLKTTTVAKPLYGKKQVSSLMHHSEQYGFAGGQSESYAANRLIKRYGYAQVIAMLAYSQRIKEQEYAPQVRSLYELEKKWLLVNDYKTKNGESGIPAEVEKEIREISGEQALTRGMDNNELNELIERRIQRYKDTGSWR